MQIAHPAFLSAAFGKLLLHAHAFCQFRGHVINRFALKTRFNHLVGEDDVGHVAAGSIQREVHLFGSGAVRQQDIGIFCRRCHVAVDHHDHFALLIILQDFMGAVDIRVLVNQTVTGIVPDHFNRDVQFIFTAHAVTQRRHLWTTFNRVGPHKHRDAGLNGVLQRRHTLKRQVVRTFTRAGITSVDANVTGQNRQHRDSAGGDFPIRMALRPPALADKGRFGCRNFACQLHNTLDRNPGDSRCPLRRFGSAVPTLTEDVSLVVTVGRRIGRQRFLVIADAVFIEERLIDQVFGDHHPGERGNQRGVGTRSNRYPLIFTTGAGIGIARIDDDHPGIGFLPRLLQVVRYPAAAHPRFAGVVAEQHHQLAVFDIRWAVTVGPAAVGIIQARGNLRR